MANFEGLSSAVITGDEERVKSLVREFLDSGVDPLEVINKGLIAAMMALGERFKTGEAFLPEVMMAAKAMKGGMEVARPRLLNREVPSAGTVLIGTVKDDLHDIGKNLVGMMLESVGFKVIDLGIDVAPEKFVQAVKEYKPDMIGMSALLTMTMPYMKDTIGLLEKEGLKNKVKVIVGGAPVSKDYADEIGADGYAPDAASAVELCKRLLA